MSQFSMVGWDYTDSRKDYEKLASLYASDISSIMVRNGIQNYVVLSTCNRFEIYFEGDPAELKLPYEPQNVLTDHDAVKHLFRVSAGLESMSIGENEILGQIKKSFTEAQKDGRSSTLLSLLFMAALNCGKKVRTKTGISSGKISIPSYCAEIIMKKVEDGSRKIAFVGAGEMTERIIKYIPDDMRTIITVYHRNSDSKQHLTNRLSGVNFRIIESYRDVVKDNDIIVTVTNSKVPLIHPDDVRDMKRFFLDISVPANVSRDVDAMQNATVMRLDNIEPEIRKNLEWKKQMVEEAELIVDQSVSAAERKILELESQDIIALIYKYSEKSGMDEIKELKKELNSGKNLDELLIPMVNSLIKKILHPHASFIKDVSKENDFRTLNRIRKHMEKFTDRGSVPSRSEDLRDSRNQRRQTLQLYRRS